MREIPLHRVRRFAVAIAAGLLLPACQPDSSGEPGTEPQGEVSEVTEITEVKSAAYGSWQSPVSAADLGGAALGLSNLQYENNTLYWTEFRPKEAGRTLLLRRIGDEAPEEMTPPDLQVRTLVHEYGGRGYVVHEGTAYFSNYADQQLYRQGPDGKAERLTSGDGLRYADCTVDAARRRLLCVREDHRGEGEPKNTIAAVSLQNGRSEVLFEGTDFAAYPRLSPDGRRMAWIAWDHPNMPWDSVALWIADVTAEGKLANPRHLNPGMKEAVIQPTWAPDGTLYFVSDRSDWWNIYRWKNGAVSVVLKREAEFGGPLWQLGARYFDLMNDGRILARVREDHAKHLILIDPDTGASQVVDLGSGEPDEFTAAGDVIYAIVNYTDDFDAIVRADPAVGEVEVVRVAGQRDLDETYISEAETMTFPTGKDEVAHAYFYRPVNPAFKGPEDTLPPLIVTVHGGPTGAADPYFDLDVQYWTTRGFAVMDVDYRGSTGYGRAYRRRLYGNWGMTDVEDVVNAARYAAGNGLADPDKLLARGGSAGGFVVLAAMAFHDVFNAGASYFGISDLEALARDTHKFESRYMDQLIGPYPERKDLYKARSPINHLNGISEPLILFQGLEDKVVPPNQSEMIAEALHKKGVPVAYLAFQGEQHGFRLAENRKRSREAELYFYGKVLGFTPAGEIEPIGIDNLPAN